MIHARLQGVARTLIMTLRARADEHLRQDRLFADEWSYEWYQWMPTYPDYDKWYAPPFQLASAIRTLIFDKITEDFLKNHKNAMVVELGGGLSSRPYRVGIDKAQWVILDLPQAMSIRYKVDAQNDNLLFITAAAQDDKWFTRLPEVDSKNVLFLAEGMLMFLSPDEVKTVVGNLGANYGGASFVFDVLRDTYRDRESENFSDMNADIRWNTNEDDLSKLGIKADHIDYLLTPFPDRWAEIGVSEDVLREENSGFVVTSTVK